MADPGRPSAVASDAGDEFEKFSVRALAVLAERDGPLRCRELAEALGEDTGQARIVERVRHRMKRLARAGRVTESAQGLFVLPGADGPSTG